MNWHEPGAELVAGALLERGVGVEAGIFTGTDAASRFLASPLCRRVLRVLAEVTEPRPSSARTAAAQLVGQLAGLPVLLHGTDGGAWPVLRMAVDLGLDTRIGLEDVLLLPDGSIATGNLDLVRAARECGAR